MHICSLPQFIVLLEKIPTRKEITPKRYSIIRISLPPDWDPCNISPVSDLNNPFEQPICNHGPSKSRADLLRWLWSSTASSQVPGTWLPRKASLHLMTCESSMPVHLVSKVLLRPWSGTIGCGFARRSRLSHQEKVLTD